MRNLSDERRIDVDRLFDHALVEQDLVRARPHVFGHPADAVRFRVGAEEGAVDVGLDLLHQHVLLLGVFRISFDDDVGRLFRILDDVGEGLACRH